MKIYYKSLLILFLILFVLNQTSYILAEEIKLTPGVLWVKTSKEYMLCVKQSYETANKNLIEMAKNETQGTWCVVMDIDDTMFTTVDYSIELEERGEAYSDKTWEEWGLITKGTPLPGAAEFTRLIKELGGIVVIITNTKAPLKEVTFEKMDHWGFVYDICLFREGPYINDKNKIIRRKDILNGTIQYYPEYSHIGPLNIIMKVGDSAHDLFNTSLYTFDDVKHKIGKNLIIIPNPLYGSWSYNPDSYITSEIDKDEQPLVVNQGENFTITLTEEREHSWEISKPLDEDIITLISSKNEDIEEDNPEGTVKKIWTFKTLKKGKTIISFEYLKNCEKNSFLESKEYFINVK